MPIRFLPALGLAVALVAAATARPVPAAADPAPVTYRPAVDPGDGVIVDHFRPPATPYAAGNRGLDYATRPLAVVHASADGVVVFAGPVGGTLHVTILHADGLRTSSSFLAELDVRAGDRVRSGQPIGRAGELLHVGVRAPDGTYLDPEALYAAGSTVLHVRLVPGGDDGTGGVGDGRAGAPRDAKALEARALESIARTPRVTVLDRARLWMHDALEARPETHVQRVAAGTWRWLRDRGACTPAGAPIVPPAGRRILVEVGGIGSTSEAASVADVDAAALGYAPGDVVRFSYRGGRVPTRAGAPVPPADLAGVPVSTYDARDSQGDLVAAGDRLDALLRAISAAAPGVPIDVVAHSQGGIVARVALDRASSARHLPPEVQTLVTLASPHQGTDLAAVVESARASPAGAARVDALQQALGVPLDPGSPAAAQLVATSDVLRSLQAHAPPPGVRITAIAARGDLVVTANRAGLDPAGAPPVVVPLDGLHAHDELPGSPVATRELALALAGRPRTCRSTGEVVTDLVVGEELSLVEATLALPAATTVGAP